MSELHRYLFTVHRSLFKFLHDLEFDAYKPKFKSMIVRQVQQIFTEEILKCMCSREPTAYLNWVSSIDCNRMKPILNSRLHNYLSTNDFYCRWIGFKKPITSYSMVVATIKKHWHYYGFAQATTRAKCRIIWSFICCGSFNSKYWSWLVFLLSWTSIQLSFKHKDLKSETYQSLLLLELVCHSIVPIINDEYIIYVE